VVSGATVPQISLLPAKRPVRGAISIGRVASMVTPSVSRRRQQRQRVCAQAEKSRSPALIAIERVSGNIFSSVGRCSACCHQRQMTMKIPDIPWKTKFDDRHGDAHDDKEERGSKCEDGLRRRSLKTHPHEHTQPNTQTVTHEQSEQPGKRALATYQAREQQHQLQP
jgi:hypothetical protein